MITGGYVERPRDEVDRMTGLSASQRKRLRRLMRGVCRQCNEPCESGRRQCRKHLDKTAAANRARWAAAKAEHLRRYGMTRGQLAKLERLSPAWQAERLIGSAGSADDNVKPVGGENSPSYVKRCVDEWLQKFMPNRQEGP